MEDYSGKITILAFDTHAISSQRILCQYLGIEFLQDIRSKGVIVELEGTLPYYNQMPQSWDIRQKANH